jgi:hypothetical protein
MASSPDAAEPLPEMGAYYPALGEFVTAFATVEAFTFLMSGLLLHLPLPVAQAALGGSARIHETADRIRKTLEVSLHISPSDYLLIEIKNTLTPALDQLMQINAIRNHILHRSSLAETANSRVLTNSHLKYKNADEFYLSSDLLRRMIADLSQIQTAIIHCLVLIQLKPSQDSMTSLLLSPWLYTQLQPTSAKGMSPDTPLKPHSQPPSSPPLRKTKKLSSSQKRALREKGDAPS